MAKDAMKRCLQDVAWPLHSRVPCRYGYLHEIKPATSVNIPAGSTDWSQWSTKNKTNKQNNKNKEESVKVGKGCFGGQAYPRGAGKRS